MLMTCYLSNYCLLTLTDSPMLVWIIVFSLYKLYLTSTNGRESRVGLEKFLEHYKAIKPTLYSYTDIKKITNDFNEKLGERSYETVYKGRLFSEIYVAVKVLRDSGKEFINEISTIRRIHHVNSKGHGYTGGQDKQGITNSLSINI